VGVAWNKIKLGHAQTPSIGALLWFVKCFLGVKKNSSYKNTPVPPVPDSHSTEDKIHIYFTPSKEKMYFLYAEKTEKYIEIKKNTY